MPSIKIYSKEQVDDLISGVTPPTVVQTTGSSTTDVMSQNAVTTALGNKADTSALPTSSQLVPSTSGASSGDILSFNGTDTEWITPSSGGSGMTPHVYNNFLELKQAINSNCDYVGQSANQKPVKGLLYYFTATSYSAFPTVLRHRYLPCTLHMSYMSAKGQYPEISMYGLCNKTSSELVIISIKENFSNVTSSTTTISSTLYICSLTSTGVTLSSDSITMDISEFIYYY